MDIVAYGLWITPLCFQNGFQFSASLEHMSIIRTPADILASHKLRPEILSPHELHPDFIYHYSHELRPNNIFLLIFLSTKHHANIYDDYPLCSSTTLGSA